MKRKAITGLFILFSVCIFAGADEQTIESEIQKVKVFLQGAQVSRDASFDYSAGSSELVMRNLPVNIDPKTIRIKSTGDFYILSVLQRKNFLKTADYSGEIKLLEKEKLMKINLLEDEEINLAVLKKKEQLLQKNTPESTSKENYWTLDELKNLVNYFGEQFDKLSMEILASERKIKELREKITLLSDQMNSYGAPQEKSVSEIVIRIFAKKPGNGKLEVQYIVTSAGWKPAYDLRVNKLNDPLTLSYKAQIFQNTGENWDRVKLILSTKNPYSSERYQSLQPWIIEPIENKPTYSYGSKKTSSHGTGYPTGSSRVIKGCGSSPDYTGTISGKVTDENGESLPGVNIVVKGTQNGTITDVDGNFSINIDKTGSALVFSYVGCESVETEANCAYINAVLVQDIAVLEEVVVIGYGTYSNYEEETPVNTEPEKFIIRDQEDLDENYEELEVGVPYSIPSDGKSYTAVLTDIDLHSDYVYKCVPKLNRNAFLHAEISGYGKYTFKPGEAGLFCRDNFLGSQDISFPKYEDTLGISFGSEEKIMVKREKLEDEEDAKAISLNRSIEKKFRITVKNNTGELIKMQVQDQYPVSAKDVIQCEPVYKDAVCNEKTGILTWDFELKPDEEKEILFGYRIKFPKSKMIIQE